MRFSNIPIYWVNKITVIFYHCNKLYVDEGIVFFPSNFIEWELMISKKIIGYFGRALQNKTFSSDILHFRIILCCFVICLCSWWFWNRIQNFKVLVTFTFITRWRFEMFKTQYICSIAISICGVSAENMFQFKC